MPEPGADTQRTLTSFQPRTDLRDVDQAKSSFLGTAVMNIFGSPVVGAVYGTPGIHLDCKGGLVSFDAILTRQTVADRQKAEPNDDNLKALEGIKRREDLTKRASAAPRLRM